MEKEYLDKYETALACAIRDFLLKNGKIDDIFPDAPDIEDRWPEIGEAYIADGVREFGAYPTVSIGWMMFVGMAMAKLWDSDWERLSQSHDIYQQLRDARGYDELDEYICQEVLELNEPQAQELTKLVADVATLAHKALSHEGFEPATPLAFQAYVRTIHQMYAFGYATQLHRLGYHSFPLS